MGTKSNLANSLYGMADYAIYPAGMLLVAPVMLHQLGVARYGIWAFATAVISTGSIIASGFGDANIQQVAQQRGRNSGHALLASVRAALGIHLLLGSLATLVALLLAPLAARHVVPIAGALQGDCLWSLRLAAIVLWFRTLETVPVSTQRAFERYGAAVRISLLTRMLSLACAACLPLVFQNVAAVMVMTVVLTAGGVFWQFRSLVALLGGRFVVPAFRGEAMSSLLRFGAFTWVQSVAGVAFSQLDRLFLGLAAGAAAVAPYALCTQLAQPIAGMAAAGLHFVFPYLARGSAGGDASHLRRSVAMAFAANLLLAGSLAGGLWVVAPYLLHRWLTPELAASAMDLMPSILLGSLLMGLSVTATYALLALGKARTVTGFYVAGGVLMVVLMPRLSHSMGPAGVALARMGFAGVLLLLYVPLFRELARPRFKEISVPELRPSEEAA